MCGSRDHRKCQGPGVGVLDTVEKAMNVAETERMEQRRSAGVCLSVSQSVTIEGLSPSSLVCLRQQKGVIQ